VGDLRNESAVSACTRRVRLRWEEEEEPKSQICVRAGKRACANASGVNE
jgi:hypothetical protein